jgi:SAM-dependent methyltransferase
MSAPLCIICGGWFRPSRLPGLLQCAACSFQTADIEISSAELEQLYSEKYFLGEEYRDYLSDRTIIEKQSRIRLKKLLAFVPESRRDLLFEIGTAYGFFLGVAREHFANVEGVDLSQHAVHYAASTLGLPVTAADFLDYEVRRQPNVFCLWDTIEHLERPDLYIEKAARHMRPHGVIAITTGDIESLVARWRGARWRLIHPPTHLHYFSRNTLIQLLRRFGFVVRYCGYDGMYRSLDTMAHGVLNIKQRRPGVYNCLKKTGLLKRDIYINLRDILFLVAEKQS